MAVNVDEGLRIEGLRVSYGRRRALLGVDLQVGRGEIVGLIGESGSGKSTLAKAVLRILPRGATVDDGSVHVGGTDVLRADDRTLQSLRWVQLSAVFQSAMNALDPAYTVEEQIAEALAAHGRERGAPARRRVAALLESVGIPNGRANAYPHELSGGMRQRVCLAMAVACGPGLLIADEPTTALDVITQHRILELLLRLREAHGLGVLLITHDIGVVAKLADRIAVMYAGRIIEHGPTRAVLDAAGHPYTIGLKNSFPTLEATGRLVSIPGFPPEVIGDVPPGCLFAPRCPFAEAECEARLPQMRSVAESHASACHFAPQRLEEFRSKGARAECWVR